MVRWLDSWAIIRAQQHHIHCQLQQHILRVLCSIKNKNNTLVSACWIYASNKLNSPLDFHIA